MPDKAVNVKKDKQRERGDKQRNCMLRKEIFSENRYFETFD